ncbi:MAG: lysine decarboxylase [bacterium TMED80]|nr:MAG: lysine decarboxylase [bacterium TMED80]
MGNKKEKNRFYFNKKFLSSPEGRSVRILSEYYGPLRNIKENKIFDTIVFFGSARIKSEKEAKTIFDSVSSSATQQEINRAKKDVDMSRYYEDARRLAKKFTEWSKGLNSKKSRYIITSGGGGGIMEAANRGAKEADGISVGLTISLPFEQTSNEYITNGLDLKFHYFFMRKFWFIYLAKALVVWPGGFGTLDEVMELLTLIQTEKIKKKLPIVLYGSEFWNNVVNWDYLVECGTISQSDLDLFYITDDIDDAFQFIVLYIEDNKLKGPNF